MSKNIQNLRGMNDVLPADVNQWQILIKKITRLFSSYGLQEIKTPILEETNLFARGVGEATDIVEKEMFSMETNDSESITLRPEGTAGTIRAAIQHGLTYNQEQRLYYFGPMFRYERPQKGRYRQFHQFGVEILGIKSVIQDIEIIQLTKDLWEILGVDQYMTLELNTIGTSQERAEYGKALVKYFTSHYNLLDEHSKARLHANPLRILDSKNQQVQQLADNAPKFTEFLSIESQNYFSQIKQGLTQLGISYKLNPKLVRGLDYYNDVVFEWTTDKLGAQATCLAGGRYDRLVEILGGKKTPGVGFALGFERLLLLIQETNPKIFEQQKDLIVVISDAQSSLEALSITNQLRKQLRDELRQNISVIQINNNFNFKKLFQKANKMEATQVLMVTQDLEQTTDNNRIKLELKNMKTGEQFFVTDLFTQVKKLLNN